MGLLKHLRSKTNLRDSEPQTIHASSSRPPPERHGHDYSLRIPEKVLSRILAHVCPHTQDFTYQPNERSQLGDGCMLCDLRDLARCAQVCRRWSSTAQTLLYRSVRIDAVHYCALEEQLADRRRKSSRHFRGRSGAGLEDVPTARLQLLCRTVRANADLASQVLLLKLPFMTRETAKADLAMTVSKLPNLRYVDLPDGFFAGDASCLPLRQELQASCADIRAMAYRAGSEKALEMLTGGLWQNLEVLELEHLSMEPATLRVLLASLPSLESVIFRDMASIDDSMLQPSSSQLPPFPALRSLTFTNTPQITGAGLSSYLQRKPVQRGLRSLTIAHTGAAISDLPDLLTLASSLQNLTITSTVSKSLALSAHPPPPFRSSSLRTLHFEITSSGHLHGSSSTLLQKPAESYYAHLADSLKQNALPSLDTLYVRAPSFANLLLTTPTPPPNPSSSSANPFPFPLQRPLGIFSKDLDELEWIFTSLSPPPPSSSSSSRPPRSSSSSTSRPLSAYSASRGLGPQWAPPPQGSGSGSGSRKAAKSVVVGNGFGGFLAVPEGEAPRSMSRSGMGSGIPGGMEDEEDEDAGDNVVVVVAAAADAAGGGRRHKSSASSAEVGGFLKPPPPHLPLRSGIAPAEEEDGRKRRSRHDLWR